MRADASECFAYAGRYEIADGTVFHSIELSTNPALIGVRSTRHIKLDGDRLTLSGPDFLPGTPRSQRIVWRRAFPTHDALRRKEVLRPGADLPEAFEGALRSGRRGCC